ncbi:MAG: energy transducer TonB [Betaproteobacteria bacterium]|nr:energy transducer TonB [Betaproteobacteria bacterium]
MKAPGSANKRGRATIVIAAFLVCVSCMHATGQQPVDPRPQPAIDPASAKQEVRLRYNAWGASRCKVTDPAYPVDARKRGLTGEVQLTAQLDRRGRLYDLVARPKGTDADAFAQATIHEASMWRARPAMDSTCKPAASRLEAVVTFAIEDGAPVVMNRLDIRTIGETPAASPPKMRNEKEVMAGLRFPFTAQEDRLEANLFIAIDVDAKTGKTLDVRVVDRDAESHVGSYFDAQVIAAFKKAEFEPVKDAQSGTLRVCRSVDFCIPK